MMPSVSDVHQDIDSIKSLLSALQLLLEVRHSQLENRLQLDIWLLQDGCDNDANNAENSNESLESLELLSVATVIDRLSLAATRGASEEEDTEMVSLNGDTNNDVRDITHKAVRQTIEENQDLKRQNILLEQQLEEKERRIKVLERLLLSEGKSYRSVLEGKRSAVNTATQVSLEAWYQLCIIYVVAPVYTRKDLMIKTELNLC